MHNHLHNSRQHQAPTSGRALVWTIVFNIVITLAEFIAGILTGALALVADATHNLSDVAALALAYLGERSSQARATKTATYGRGRVEVFTALFSALSLLLIAAFICWEAYDRFVNPTQITDFPVFLTVACVGLLGNLGSVWILRRENSVSLNRKAALLHLVFDAASSVAVIAGGIVMFSFGWMVLDPILSVIIAGMIVWSSLDVLRQGGRILLEVAPENLNFDEIKTALESHPQVRNAHDLHIWSLSSTETALSSHVCVDQADTVNIDHIIKGLNELLASRFNITHSTLQVETGICQRPDDVCGVASPSDSTGARFDR
ncbi:MAG: cation diffusion facilitator family transporter [Candidatus Zixiibacteriota bacterium]